jgi:hypothetical protein
VDDAATAELDALRSAGRIRGARRCGLNLLALTAAGRRALGKARSAGEAILPESPPTKPASDRARALLDEFPRFWDLETDPVERRKLLLSLFEQIWAQNGRIVAVQPHDDFLPYFQTKHTSAPGGAEDGSDGGRTRECHPAD